MTLVKVCGLRRPEDAEIVSSAGADMAGFVFYPPSKRNVSPEQAASIRARLDPSVRAVGVFVDEDPRVIADLVGSGTIDMVQLHGVEDDEYIRGLRRLVDVPIIKSFIVRSGEDLRRAGESEADLVLLDAGKGSGTRFDWSLLEGFGREYILSGGLDPSIVAEAVAELRPMGVDVSSGVETDGFKDAEKVSSFVCNARARSHSAWPAIPSADDIGIGRG